MMECDKNMLKISGLPWGLDFNPHTRPILTEKLRACQLSLASLRGR